MYVYVCMYVCMYANMYVVDSHESSSIKVLGVSDGLKLNIAISTNL